MSKTVPASDTRQIEEWLSDVESECGDFSDAESEVSEHKTDSEQEASDDDDYDDNSAIVVVDNNLSFQINDNVATTSKHNESVCENDRSVLINTQEGPDNNERVNVTVSNNAPHRYFYGKNRYKMSSMPPTPSRTRSCNIVTHLPGVCGDARQVKPSKPIEAWSLLIDEPMVHKIVQYTNIKITELSSKFGSTATYVNHTDEIEIHALFGLLILSGSFKSGHEDVESLWASDGTGRDIFRSTMPLKRFLFLITALRFDEYESREERKANGDKLAAISEIFQDFIVNCQSNFSVSEYLTIDEMLVAFRGRCSFRVYLKNKPNRYGLKIMCLCDAKNSYLFNAFIYAGKGAPIPNPRKLSIPTLSVLELVAPVMNTNRNITADNWFSSMELVNELLKVGLTYVGTMRKNKREIPLEFLPQKKRTVGTSEFGFTRDRTLVSHVPKKNTSVILVSSMHHSKNIDPITKKPEIILFYNETKGGVDTLDQKCACYSASRRTRRWPLAIFYAMVNISTVNAHIIYTNIGKEISRRIFAIDLGKDLIRENMTRRLVNTRLPRELQQLIRRVSGLQESQTPQNNQDGPRKRKRCQLCPYKVDKKHSTMCNNCQQTVCKNHSIQRLLCSRCHDW